MAQKNKQPNTAPEQAGFRDAKEEIAYLRQKFGSLMMRGYYRECFKLIEDNLRLLYFKERWPENFFSSLRSHKRCYASMEIGQPYDEYLTALLKKLGIPTVFVVLLRGADSSIDWTGDYFKMLATVAQSKGEYEEALGYCELFLKIEPANSSAYLLKGWILEDMDRGPEAVEVYRQALEVNESNYQALHSLAKYYAKREPDRALTYIEQAILLSPGDPAFFATKGDILQHQGRTGEAMECFERAGHLDPLNPEYPYRRGELLLAQNQTLAALRQYGRAVGVDEKHLPSLMRLATLSADDHLALPYINTVCSEQPDNLEAALLRAKLLHRIGNNRMAAKQYKKVVELDPKNLEAFVHLGELCLKDNNPTQALRYFDRAVELAPRSADSHFGKAQALETLGDEPEAIKEYKITVNLDETRAKAWGALGLLHVETSPASAVEYLSKAVALAQDNPYYHQAMGRALVKTGRTAEAMESFNQAVRHDPGNAELQYQLALMLDQTGNKASAIEHYRFAASLDPNMAAAYYGLARLTQFTQPDMAVTYINRALRLDAVNGEYYYLKAKILDALGQRRDSMNNLKRSLESDASNTEVMEELSQILSGESPRVALMYINRAIELAPQNSAYLCTRANLLYKVGAVKQAMGQYEASLKLNEHNAEALYGIGHILADKGDKKGLEYLDRAISLDGTNPEYHAAKAAYLGRNPDTYREAVACYDTAVSLDGDRWDIILQKGILQQLREDLADAQISYRRVLLLNRDCLEANARMGVILAERGVAAGMSYLEHAIELDPESGEHHVWLARLLFSLGREEEAEDHCRQAIALGVGGDGEVYYTLARALCQKLPESSLKYIHTAIQQGGDKTEYHLLLGDIHLLLGEDGQARAAYAKALELSPNCHEALAKTAAIHLAHQDAAGLEPIQRALELSGDNPEYLHIKAGLLAGPAADLPGALLCAEQAVKLAPDRLAFRERYVEILERKRVRVKLFFERRKLEKARERQQAIEAALLSADALPEEQRSDDCPPAIPPEIVENSVDNV